MDILSEIKKWLPPDEEISNHIIFGKKENQILGQTNRRSFYYKNRLSFYQKKKLEDLIVCPGTFPMVGRVSSVRRLIMLALGLLLIILGLSTIVLGPLPSAPLAVFGLIILIIGFLAKPALIVYLGTQRYVLSPLQAKDYSKIQKFIQNLY